MVVEEKIFHKRRSILFPQIRKMIKWISIFTCLCHHSLDIFHQHISHFTQFHHWFQISLKQEENILWFKAAVLVDHYLFFRLTTLIENLLNNIHTESRWNKKRIFFGFKAAVLIEHYLFFRLATLIENLLNNIHTESRWNKKRIFFGLKQQC